MTSKKDFMAYLKYFMLKSCKQFELERRGMTPPINPQPNPFAINALIGCDLNSAFLAQRMPLGQTFYEQRLHSPVQMNDVQHNHSLVQPEPENRERSSIAKSEYELACNLNCIVNDALEEKVTNFSGANFEETNKVKLANAKMGIAICATKKLDFEQSYKQYLMETESRYFKRRKLNEYASCITPSIVYDLTSDNESEFQNSNQKLNATVSRTTAPCLIQDRSHLSRSKKSTSQLKEEVKERTKIVNKIIAAHEKNLSIAKSTTKLDKSFEEVNATSKNVEEASAVNLKNYVDSFDEVNVKKAHADELMYKEFEIMDNVESNENRKILKVNSYCDYIEKLKNKNRVKVPPTDAVIDTKIKLAKKGDNNFTVVPMPIASNNEAVVNNNFTSNDKTLDDFFISLNFLNTTIDGFDKSVQVVTHDSKANISTCPDSNPISKQNCSLLTWITKQGSNTVLDIETYLAIEEYSSFINL